MDFKAYEYVMTVADEKSFSKASERLFISQPSLSQYINRIEDRLGVKLFNRSTVPLALTHDGELYIEAAKKIIHIHRQLLNTYDESRGFSKGRLAIGVTPSKANHLLPLVLPVFKERYPHIELTIIEASSTDLEDQLEKGFIDLCILNLPVVSYNLLCEPLFTEKIVLAVPPANESAMFFSKKQTLSYEDIKQLADEPFILLHSGQRLRQVANSIFSKAHFKPKILLETQYIETSLKLSAAGVGFTFVPETLALYSGLKCLPNYFSVGEPPLTWTLGLAFPSESCVTKSAIAFGAVAKEMIHR